MGEAKRKRPKFEVVETIPDELEAAIADAESVDLDSTDVDRFLDTLPKAFTEEVLGSQLLDNAKALHMLRVNMRAARSVGNDAKAMEFALAVNTTVAAMNRVLRDYPGARKVARELADAQTVMVKQERQARLRG